jgi:RNA 2',3'-cyclic 3'-phosphodiesterase
LEQLLPMDDLKRIFIALKTPPSAFFSETLEELKLAVKNIPIRWVKPDYLHMTFLYLGSTNNHQLSLLEEILEKICRQQNPFFIEVKGMGCFYTNNKPRVLWVGITENISLNNIYNSIIKETDSLFIAENKAFLPHITIGRIKQSAGDAFDVGCLKKFDNIAFDNMLVNNIYLYESILMPDEAEYKPLRIFKFAGK